MADYVMKNEEDTRRFGMKLGREAQPGDIIAMVGDLGTGKTTLTSYIAEALGIEEKIPSPTFPILLAHEGGRLPLYHFDLYRLEKPEDMLDLGYEEYFFGDGLTVIEWADRAEEYIPENAKIIFMEMGSNQGERIYRCSF